MPPSEPEGPSEPQKMAEAHVDLVQLVRMALAALLTSILINLLIWVGATELLPATRSVPPPTAASMAATSTVIVVLLATALIVIDRLSHRPARVFGLTAALGLVVLLLHAAVRLVGAGPSFITIEAIGIKTIANVATLGLTVYLLIAYAIVEKQPARS